MTNLERVNDIISEELSKVFQEITEYTQFKLSRTAQILMGRIAQEALNQSETSEKEKQQ